MDPFSTFRSQSAASDGLVRSRRDFLLRAGSGFGALALVSLLNDRRTIASENSPSTNPLAPKPGQLPARAKSVIFLFMDGVPSQLDTFDPKPKVNELAGQPLPDS